MLPPYIVNREDPNAQVDIDQSGSDAQPRVTAPADKGWFPHKAAHYKKELICVVICFMQCTFDVSVAGAPCLVVSMVAINWFLAFGEMVCINTSTHYTDTTTSTITLYTESSMTLLA